MSFISYKFILFLITTIILYFIFPKKYRFIVLLFANTLFYLISCKFNTIYLLISIVSVYISGLLITKFKKHKKIIFILTILFNLCLLIFLKEHNFLIKNINSIFNSNISLINIIVPLGISYYTLVAIGYLIDVYLGRIKSIKNFIKLYLAMTFFPLMVEGPIVKVNEVADDLYNGHDFDYNNLKYGYLRILLGFIKKLVIADRVAILVDKVFAGGYSGTTVIFGMIFYVIQIYSEFSGCMDIVLGVGRIFSINIPENFKEPFFSRNIQEFWRRWHITLGRWLKDYVFFPITMSKFNMKLNLNTHKKLPRFLADTITSFLPLFAVWALMGLWHGFGWKYFIYGMYYFIIILMGMLFKPVFDFIIKKLKIKTDCFSYHLFQSVRTFILVTFGLTLFRSNGVRAFLKILISIPTVALDETKTILGDNLNLVIFSVSMLFILDLIRYRGINIRNWIESQNIVFRYIVFLVPLLFVIIFGMYGYGYNPSDFIYGGF